LTTNHTLDLTIVPAYPATLLENLQRNDIEAQIAIHATLTNRLVSARAYIIAVMSIAP